MKLLVLTLLSAAGFATGGASTKAAADAKSGATNRAARGAVAWPGAIPVSDSYQNTIFPAHTRGFGFSTTQFINTLPASYQFGLPPQFSYQIQHLNPFAQYQPFYYPGFYPGSTVFYPTYPHPGPPISPVQIPQHPGAIIPQPPQPSPPSNQPSQDLGDSDSSVIESAEFPHQDESQTQADSPRPQPPQSPPPSNFPSFPDPGQINAPQRPESPSLPPQSSGPTYPQLPVQGIPSYPGFPSFPQFPQGSAPSFPQYPQGSGDPIFPQFPQLPPGSFPGFPSAPSFPQTPSPSPPPSYPSPSPSPTYPSPSPSPSYPSADGDKGNDEDSISVESA